MAAEVETIAAFGRALRAGRTTAEHAAEACLDAIRTRDGRVNAYIHVADTALDEARQADREIAQGRDRGPLHGVPISLKDLIDVRGMPTSAASRVRRGHVATETATVVQRLRNAGAVILGKVNLHEFAFGTTNEDSAFGPVRHPLDETRTPGGSSGGSAASVLARMAYASIGTDTGGSIRIPSAFCGLVGLKPPFGAVPTTGVVPLSRTLDHVGPICRTVEDAALVYEVLHDPTIGDHSGGLGGHPGTLRGLRLGVLSGYFLERLDPDVEAAFGAAQAALRAAGAILDAVEIPHAVEIAPAYVHITLAEAATVHARTLESRAEEYTPNVRNRLEMGRYVLAEDYLRARSAQAILAREVETAIEGRHALVLPTTCTPALPLGTETVRVGGAEEPARNVAMRLTQLFNLSGHPAITVPCGSTPEGLPTGLQLVGSRHDTAALLAVAALVEPTVKG